ncbi:MAG: allophanate hydrolase [Myxococcota bacterium]|nr:allophanate hydrolase [Myxococcota bacterium]
MSRDKLSLAFDSLHGAFASGELTPHDVIDEVFGRMDRDRQRVRNVWLHTLPATAAHAAVERAIARREAGAAVPLLGIPFAVKDNIDVAGMPTTAACPELAYVPESSAPVVQRLIEAGAIVIGKVNLDQLATGLVGTRSPYGTPTNPFDPRMIPGGSSSGSAVAVAVGHVSFALATDTAGSGRIPAGFNNIVGVKPSHGTLSARGVVPACRSLDCVSVFALTVPDACAVVNVATQWDERDAFSRHDAPSMVLGEFDRREWRIGVPRADQLVFFDDSPARRMFERSVDRLRGLGCGVVEIDFEPFRAAGELLYGGPWVAERLLAAGPLLETKPEALLPVIRDILREAKRYGALDVFAGQYRLREIQRATTATWRAVDAFMVPTAPTIYRVADVIANPRTLNANLGTYTTFVNLLDLAAVSVPAGFRDDGLPSGITFIGVRGSESALVTLADAHHRALGGTLGATEHGLPAAQGCTNATPSRGTAPNATETAAIVVVGAHLTGQPLNDQLTGAGGTLVRDGATAARYRLYALRGTVPPKPGLVRVREGGCPIEIEVWRLDVAAFGKFVAAVPRPLCIGSVELEDGTFVSGFLCEPDALVGAVDITSHGGWRAYLQAQSAGGGQTALEQDPRMEISRADLGQ